MNDTGTNYYAVKNGPTTSEPIHIGKSSAGWLFNFQTQNDTWNKPPVIWNTFTQVKEWLKKYTVDSKDYVIMDEYDEIIPFEDFVAMVEKKQKDEHNQKNKLMYDELVKSLRQCAEASCAGCKNDLAQIGCRGLLQHEAADAIEELIRKEKFHAFLWNTIQPNEMEQYISMYNSGNIPQKPPKEE